MSVPVPRRVPHHLPIIIETRTKDKGSGVEIAIAIGLSAVFVAFILAWAYVASAPIESALSCHARVEGNVQFDGREIRTAGLYDWDGNLSEPTFWNGLPARSSMNAVDFTQARINVVDIECEGSGKAPFYALERMMGVDS